MAEPNPTVLQRELGMRLRQLRVDRNHTIEDVGKVVGFSSAKISRIETAARRASPRDVRDLCHFYDVSAEEEASLTEKARHAREEAGWWKQYDDLKLEPYIGLEQEASAITAFDMSWIPALLQTEAYAEEVVKGIARRISADVLKQRVQARLRRQKILDQPTPPRYRAIIDESALRRIVGSPVIMIEQLDKILRSASQGNSVIQAFPFTSGVPSSVDSNFVLLEFGDGPLRGFVFVESLARNLYQDRATDVERYRETVEYLRDGALSPRDSLAFIADIKEQHAAIQHLPAAARSHIYSEGE